MSLSLKTMKCPDGVGQERREVKRAPFAIGRGPESDWVLPDPDKILSKRHCNLTAKGETWLVTDISSNGTFLNGSALDPELPHPLRDRDHLSFGKYELEVRISEAYDDEDDASEAPTRFGNWSEKLNEKRLTSDPFPPEDRSSEAAAHPSIGLPQDFDTLNDGNELAEHPYAARDDTPDMNAHFQPPRPSSDLLPDDWDDEVQAPKPAGRDEPATREIDAESPERSASLPTEDHLPAPHIDADDTPFGLEPDNLPSRAKSAEAPAPAEPYERRALAPAVGDGGTSDAEGFAAFASGAGYNGPAPHNMRAALQTLGSAFRAMVSGLRRSIIARASVKTEFRIDQTMIRAAGNNPIKFAADDDDALAALIGVGRHGRIDAPAAVTEAMRDIAMHELAVAAAMQSAVRELLAELAPDKVMRGVRRTKLDELIGSRKQVGWDAYVDRHAEITRALADEFDSVFGKSFARAYETALKEVSDADKRGDRA